MTSPKDRADRAFLRLCGVTDRADGSGDAELRSLDTGQWERIGGQARFHGFAGLVARNLEWLGERTGMRPPILDSLQALRARVLTQNLARKAAARVAAEALQGAGIPFAVLKGVALTEETYGDLSLRGFNDFDVLVPLDCVNAAHAAIRDLGYMLTSLATIQDYVRYGAHAAGMSRRDGMSVDLHWAIAPDLVDTRRRELVWNDCVPGGPDAVLPGMRLSAELALIHHAKHFHSHQYGILKPLVDFHVTRRVHATSLDLARYDAIACALGLRRVLGIVDAAARRSLAGEGEAKGAARFIDDGLIADSRNQSRLENWLRFLLSSGSLASSARAVAAILLPNRLTLAQFFNRPFSADLYPRYYWRQLVKVVTFSAK